MSKRRRWKSFREVIRPDDLGIFRLFKGLPQWLSGKESACNAGVTRDVGLIPGSGRSPGGGHGRHSSILAWRIPWTEKPGRLQSIGPQRVGLKWSNFACTGYLKTDTFFSEWDYKAWRILIIIWLLKVTLSDLREQTNVCLHKFKMDNQQGPTVQHMELCSILCGSLEGRESGGEWIHVYICMSSFTGHLKLSHY